MLMINSVFFALQAKSLNTLQSTILSRCQYYRTDSFKKEVNANSYQKFKLSNRVFHEGVNRP
jgi:DNA polymerase III gamma/tau subunit